MGTLEILLLIFLGILIFVLGFLAYEIWSVRQIYNNAKNIANLKRIQKVASWIIARWRKSRKLTATVFLLMIITFTGCHYKNTPETSKKTDQRSVIREDSRAATRVVTFLIIDSCEYLHINYGWTHKGNCRFCKKREDEKINRIIDSIRAANK